MAGLVLRGGVGEWFRLVGVVLVCPWVVLVLVWVVALVVPVRVVLVVGLGRWLVLSMVALMCPWVVLVRSVVDPFLGLLGLALLGAPLF